MYLLEGIWPSQEGLRVTKKSIGDAPIAPIRLVYFELHLSWKKINHKNVGKSIQINNGSYGVGRFQPTEKTVQSLGVLRGFG